MAVVKPKAATPAKPAVAAKSEPKSVASMLPDEMAAGGLKDDFDGVIIKVRLVPWDYNGNLDHHVLGVAVTIAPEDGDEFVQTYSAGDLENFVPSMDGETSVDLDNGEGEALEGIYALRVGKKEMLSNSSNWATFIVAALDAGFPREKVAAAAGAVTFFEGTTAHFNRVPQKKRSGIVSQAAGADGKPKNSDILVITEIKSVGEAAAAKTAATKPAASAEPAVANLDDAIVTAVLPAITAAGDNGLPKGKLAAIVLKAFTGKDKPAAVKRIGEAEFLENRDEWGYDPESGLLYPA